MKTFEVTLLLVINAPRDFEATEPQTKRVEYTVEAETEGEARTKAKEMDKSGLSIWESYADEVEEIERNEDGDELVVGCAICGEDVHTTNDDGVCKKCSKK